MMSNPAEQNVQGSCYCSQMKDRGTENIKVNRRSKKHGINDRAGGQTLKSKKHAFSK